MYIISVPCGWHIISDHYLASKFCSYNIMLMCIHMHAVYKVCAMCMCFMMPKYVFLEVLFNHTVLVTQCHDYNYYYHKCIYRCTPAHASTDNLTGKGVQIHL